MHITIKDFESAKMALEELAYKRAVEYERAVGRYKLIYAEGYEAVYWTPTGLKFTFPYMNHTLHILTEDVFMADKEWEVEFAERVQRYLDEKERNRADMKAFRYEQYLKLKKEFEG